MTYDELENRYREATTLVGRIKQLEEIDIRYIRDMDRGLLNRLVEAGKVLLLKEAKEQLDSVLNPSNLRDMEKLIEEVGK